MEQERHHSCKALLAYGRASSTQQAKMKGGNLKGNGEGACSVIACIRI